MYVFMHVCMYVCINVCVSLYHTYMMHVCTQRIFKYKITLFNFLNGLVIPLDLPLIRMHRGNCNLTMADSKL